MMQDVKKNEVCANEGGRGSKRSARVKNARNDD